MTGRSVWEKLRPHLNLPDPGLLSLSGGADSSVLAGALVKAGATVVAATFRSPLHPAEETGLAEKLADRLGLDQVVIDEDPLVDRAVAANPRNRCYLCKKRRLAVLTELAAEQGLSVILDGANADDAGRYRPGLAAAAEAGVVSPLARAGVSKAEVYLLGRFLGLDDWLAPASSCLATRFPYDTDLTDDDLLLVDRAEAVVADLLTLERGAFRVRIHGSLARLELPISEQAAVPTGPVGAALAEALKKLGFDYVTLDLSGFESGGMDRKLND